MIFDIIQIIFFLILLIGISIPFGFYMKRVYNNEANFASRMIRPVENSIYKILRVNPIEEMNWKQYAGALIIFNILGIFILTTILMLQKFLPFNPQKFGGMSFALALNTATSFVTNTNFQSYGGESTLSYFSQMAGLTVQNFVSAATGMCAGIALIRGLVRRQTKEIGNFWSDLVKTVLYILLPASIIISIVLVSQGVIQNLDNYKIINTLEGVKQTIPMGPVASQEAIKIFGTNGGGFFNANSSHPFENPNAITNLIEMLSMLLIPAGFIFTFERMSNNKKQGYIIFITMLVLFVMMFSIAYISEIKGNPILGKMGISLPTSYEGKEIRFGLGNSLLYSVITTATSSGAVNNMHSSLTPLAGMILLLQIMLGEVIFGGAGAGFYSIMIFVIFTVFIVGLMVGRTPEYLGKKIESFEVKMAILGILIPSVLILVNSGIASITGAGTSSILNKGPHGLTEILYAFSSGAGNNGSAFAGLNTNTNFYNYLMAFTMFCGRFGVIIPVIAISGSLANKNIIPESSGTFKTTSIMFVFLLIAIILIIGA
ncbi:MAG: potassium-transporting ATPase subunit KdpA, partial [Actinobacteria bacterium]|nr:potassium-transporting ATPase subunit KdpA [Actinomycetota bacterium]